LKYTLVHNCTTLTPWQPPPSMCIVIACALMCEIFIWMSVSMMNNGRNKWDNCTQTREGSETIHYQHLHGACLKGSEFSWLLQTINLDLVFFKAFSEIEQF
jgi:hypothetical protein